MESKEIQDYSVLTDPADADMALVRDVSDNGTVAAGKLKQLPLLTLKDYIGGFTPDSAAYQALGGAHSAKLRGWFAALAARAARRVNVAVVGDSVTAGQGASHFARTWPQCLAASLNARFPVPGLGTHGRGLLLPYLYPEVSTWSLSEYASWSPSVNTGDVLNFGYGPALFGYNIAADSGYTVTFSLDGDSADIFYAVGSGFGSFKYQVDGGGYASVDTSAGDFADGQAEHVSLGSAGAHTLEITVDSAGGGVFLDGVREYNGDYAQGIGVDALGFSGSTTHYWQAAGGAISQPQALAALQPDLIVFELGANDYSNGISAADSGANLAADVSEMLAAFEAPPPVLLLAVYDAFSNGDLDAATWETYVAQQRAIAAAGAGTDVLDLTLRMPPTNDAVTWGLYDGDGIHPSDAGHQLIADHVAQFLSPA